MDGIQAIEELRQHVDRVKPERPEPYVPVLVVWEDWLAEFDRLDDNVADACEVLSISIPGADDSRGVTGLVIRPHTDVPVKTFAVVNREDWLYRLQRVETKTRAITGKQPEAIEWSQEDSPSKWAKRFRMSLNTLKERIYQGKIHCDPVTTKRWRIAVADLPK